jgi:hypothetical protein
MVKVERSVFHADVVLLQRAAKGGLASPVSPRNGPKAANPIGHDLQHPLKLWRTRQAGRRRQKKSTTAESCTEGTTAACRSAAISEATRGGVPGKRKGKIHSTGRRSFFP